MSEKRGMQLERVVLLGRTFEEYRRYFLIEPDDWPGKRVLDVAGGVSSFCAEANELGIGVTSCDPIYDWEPQRIRAQAEPDLDHVYKIVDGLQTYRWDFYRDRDHMRELRARSLHKFLPDYSEHRSSRYVPGQLPRLPFADQTFDLTLVSYFLFAYEDKFSYEFHRDAILDLMRVTRGEARIYPTVTFEAEQSSYVPKLLSDPALADFCFEEVKTDFEFLLNSNRFLRVTRQKRS
jgi:hypothetical protein